MNSWPSVARAHVWWVLPSLVVALLVGWGLGAAGWMALYGSINVLGMLMYSLESGAANAPATKLMQALAIAQLPTGLLGLVGIFSAASPTNSKPWIHSAIFRTPRMRDDAKLQGESEWPPKRWP